MNRRTFITGLLATTALPAAVPALARQSIVFPPGTVEYPENVFTCPQQRTVSASVYVRRQINEWMRCDGAHFWPDDIAYSVETDAVGEVVRC